MFRWIKIKIIINKLRNIIEYKTNKKNKYRRIMFYFEIPRKQPTGT